MFGGHFFIVQSVKMKYVRQLSFTGLINKCEHNFASANYSLTICWHMQTV